MIYIIGGAPRVGKTILTQQLAARLQIGWISSDLLMVLLKEAGVRQAKQEWNATPAAIKTSADIFFPFLERFIWGIHSMTSSYVIEGVDFLPEQVAQLSAQYKIRSVFLGCREMTMERFEQFPGCSPGYANLPVEMKRQIVKDIAPWSELIRQEAHRFGFHYIDMSSDFPSRLQDALAYLMAYIS